MVAPLYRTCIPCNQYTCSWSCAYWGQVFDLPTNRLAPTTNSHLKKEHCMDDLDRELKLIQIQRERLALERELASQGADKSVKKAIKSIWHVISALPKVLGKFLTRWWKVTLTVFFLVFCAFAAATFGFYATSTWKEYQRRQAEEKNERQEKWWTRAEEYAVTQCGSTFSCTGLLHQECLDVESRYKICLNRSISDFKKQTPSPKD